MFNIGTEKQIRIFIVQLRTKYTEDFIQNLSKQEADKLKDSLDYLHHNDSIYTLKTKGTLKERRSVLELLYLADLAILNIKYHFRYKHNNVKDFYCNNEYYAYEEN